MGFKVSMTLKPRNKAKERHFSASRVLLFAEKSHFTFYTFTRGSMLRNHIFVIALNQFSVSTAKWALCLE